MDERSARQILLVRALEADDSGALIGEEDRRHAARAAAELVRWQASDQRRPATDDMYVARRAELLLQRAAAREPAIGRAEHAFEWRPWVGVALPLLALVAGVVTEQVADRQHVNLLAFPLLLLVLWNLVVYVVLAVRAVLSMIPGRGAQRDANPAGLRRWLVLFAERTGARLRGRSPLARALPSYAAAWMRASAPLTEARAARILHWSAALFGAGAVIGLYARGLAFDYRVGWESTFLEASTVHAFLGVVLAPAAKVLAMPLPGVAEVEALRFGGTAAPASGARWIHLYATTVALAVIVPRAVLAAIAGMFERHWQRRFPLDLAEPYYRRLLGAFGGGPVRLRVVPYSYRVDETAAASLAALARVLLGENADAQLRPQVDYGAEDRAEEGINTDDPEVALTAALFSLAATPENESHGRFLDRLRDHVASRVLVVIDESPLSRRFGANAAAAERIGERRAAWLSFCTARGVPAATVDLAAPDLARAERELGPALRAPT